jgi:hypothetical protein
MNNIIHLVLSSKLLPTLHRDTGIKIAERTQPKTLKIRCFYGLCGFFLCQKVRISGNKTGTF